MKKLFPFIKNYQKETILNIVFNLLAIVFGLFSLSLIYPFLQILFDKTPINPISPTFQFSATFLFDYINFTLGNFINNYGKETTLLLVCVFVIIVFLLKNLCRFLAKYFLAIVRNGVVADLRQKLYNKIIDLPLAFFSEKQKGDTIARATVDLQEVEWGVLSVLELIFVSPVNIILSLVFLFSINAKLTISVLILAPIAGFVIGSVGKTLKKVSDKAQEKMGGLLSHLEETMGGLNIIKAFTAENYFSNKFETTNREHAHFMTKMLHRRDLSSPMSEFLSVSVIVIVLYIGTRMVLNNSESLDSAQFITYLAILSQLIPPAKAFTDAYYRIIKGSASLDRINEIIEAKTDIKDAENAIEISQFNNAIEFKNISFSYTEKPVLKNISFSLEKGKVVALVGASGSGKSTIAKLLTRFYDVEQGEILIDGKSIKNISQKSLRRQMGIVSQHAILFNDTIENNIALGNEINTQKIVEASQIANAHNFIKNLENGYKTNIGDGGFLLSGGQRQRLTIARAIYHNSPILILDEATSALDAESEKLVQNAIDKLLHNRTVLVIAHRLSTIRNADNIIVLDNGEIIEQGTHNDLLKMKGVYEQMVGLQFPVALNKEKKTK